MRRFEGLDCLRGLMLVLMMFNHLLFMNYSKWIGVTQVSYGLFGYVTAAEIFYFLSGLICALVFTKKVLAAPDEVRRKMRSRAAELMMWHIFTLALAVALVLVFPSTHVYLVGNPFMGKLLESPGMTFALGLALLAMPPFLNILPLYIVYLYVTPPILQRLAKRQYGAVLAVSLALWGLAQTRLWFEAFAGLQARWPALPFNAGYFDPMGWQLLFVGGLITGSLQSQGRLAPLAKGPTALVGSAVLCVLFWLHKQGLIAAAFPLFPSPPPEWMDVGALGLLRVLNFVCLAVAAGLVLAKFPRVFRVRPLIFLGQHSLQVFVYHVVFLYATIGLKGWIDGLAVWPRCLVFAAFAASLWAPAWAHELLRARTASDLEPLKAARKRF